MPADDAVQLTLVAAVPADNVEQQALVAAVHEMHNPSAKPQPQVRC
jgi:hypothetical protein